MSKQSITPELRRWLSEQIQAGEMPGALLESMMASGWDTDVAWAALRAVGQVLTPSSDAPKAGARLPVINAQGRGSIWAHDRAIKVHMQVQQPCLAVLGDVLSAQECQDLMALASPRLDRSETVAQTPGGSEVNAARTSQGMFFNRGENELCERLESRIAALTGWPIECGEGLQVLRYLPGAEYRPHFDYFDVDQASAPAILKRGGQRVATLVMYLNTPESGGATTFPDAGLSVQAHAGSAVFFSYEQANPASLSLHGGAPVIVGEKWVATKWFRESAFE